MAVVTVGGESSHTQTTLETQEALSTQSYTAAVSVSMGKWGNGGVCLSVCPSIHPLAHRPSIFHPSSIAPPSIQTPLEAPLGHRNVLYLLQCLQPAPRGNSKWHRCRLVGSGKKSAGIDAEELKAVSQRGTCTPEVISIHSSHRCKQPKCPSRGEWRNKTVAYADYGIVFSREKE